MSADPARQLPPSDAVEEESYDPSPEDDVQLSLLGHLEELRDRLKMAVIFALAGTVLAYAFRVHIYWWLMQPVSAALPESNPALVFTNATDPFFTYLKVALYSGIFIGAPGILYQVWAFIAPGLYRRERRAAVPFVVLGTLFFFIGGAFAHYIVLPFALDFLIGDFTVEGQMVPMLSIKETFSLVLTIMLAFAVIFEMPLIITLMARMGLVTSAFLAKYRRYAILLNVVLAAILTPTGDPLNLSIMAVPMILFYEIGILGAKLVEKPAEPASEAAEES